MVLTDEQWEKLPELVKVNVITHEIERVFGDPIGAKFVKVGPDEYELRKDAKCSDLPSLQLTVGDTLSLDGADQ